MSGKGSVQRPPSVPRAEYDRRWTETFAGKRLAAAMERSRIGNGMLKHHPASKCAGQHCSIHNPSDHPLRDFPLHWRQDRGLMERICEHGIGHPDPDHLDYVRRMGGDVLAESIHGCDGCCR